MLAKNSNGLSLIQSPDTVFFTGVKTYSGYVPISQAMFDWEPPTSLDNQTKPTTPPDPNQGQSHAGNPDGNMYARKPVEGLVYTEVGEKARPTPYIYEIKARKFEKRRKNKLFVGGLVFEATKEFLYDLFEKYGELEDGRYTSSPDVSSLWVFYFCSLNHLCIFWIKFDWLLIPISFSQSIQQSHLCFFSMYCDRTGNRQLTWVWLCYLC